MWRTTIAIASAMVVASCGVPFTQIAGPNGKPEYVMKCRGIVTSMPACQRLAHELCPHGYVVVDDTDPVGGRYAPRYTAPPVPRGYLRLSCK